MTSDIQGMIKFSVFVFKMANYFVPFYERVGEAFDCLLLVFNLF
jgi:hypothetical protein